MIGAPTSDKDWQAENDADTILRAKEIERDAERTAKAKTVLREKMAALKQAVGRERPDDHLAVGYRKPGKKR